MANYCSLADVQAEFRSVSFGASSTPTGTAVSGFITQATAEINAKVGMVYQVPITATDDVALLQQIAIGLVAGRVKNILPVKTGSEEVNQGKGGQGDTLIKEARKMLEQIRLGDLALPGSSLISNYDSVSSGNQRNGICPVFKRDTTQW